MRCLIKFTFLTFAFCLNSFSFEFSDPGQYSLFMNLKYFPGMRQIDAELISDEYFRYGNDIYKITSTSDYFVLSPSEFNNFAIYVSDFYFFNSTPKTAYCEGANTDQTIYRRNCSIEKQDVRSKIDYQNVKKIISFKVATCQADENFNTDTQQCQKCSDGQSWDPATNSCFNDCTDPNKNKYGFTDGSCTDCSAAKTTGDIYRCFCGSLGLGVPGAVNDIGVIGKPGYFKGECSNGFVFEYKDPEFKPDPKPDDNKTKPDDPNPNPDDNKTKPDDPNNPNQGGGNQGGNQGGNNGGNQGNNTNPDSKDGDLCKKNPKDPKCKPETKPGDGNTTIVNNNGGGNNSNGDNLKFTPDGSADKYEKDINDFAGKFKDAAGGIVGEFGNFKKGVDQLIANIQGKGIKDVKSQAIPSSCPREFTVDMFGNSYLIKIDYCKYIAPAANVLYYIFYILFFLAFLLGVYKTVLFLI